MKISLERIDTRGLRVDLPGSHREAITVHATAGLRGTIDQSDGHLALSDVAAESIELAALRIRFGELVLSSTGGAAMTGLGLALDRTPDRLVLSAALTAIAAKDLEVAIDDVRVRGRVTLTAPDLVVRGDEGSLAAARVEIDDFELRIGDVTLTAGRLAGGNVKLGWGEAGFWLHANTLEAPVLGFDTTDVHVAAGGVELGAFRLDGKQLTFGRAALAAGQVTVTLRSSKEHVTATYDVPALEAPAPPPLLDLATLDTLSGQLDVDVAVDLTVPIIGRRQATHRLRIAIVDGTLDYRALEHNLAKLEDALLDFSVRDDALVLERVNPLFPARGHGKPVVIWDVTGADLELARRERVRLSVLPKARLAADAEERDAPPSKKGSSVALRELGLLRINARLALAPAGVPTSGQLRLERVGSLTLGGNVFHEPNGSREGSTMGELSNVAGSLHALMLGTTRVSASSFTAAALSPVEIAFADVQPTKLEVGLQQLVLEGVAIAL